MSVTSEASTAWKGSLMDGSGTVALDTSGNALVLWTGMERPEEFTRHVILGRLFDRVIDTVTSRI